MTWADALNAIAGLPPAFGGGDTIPAEAPARADGSFWPLAYTDGAVVKNGFEGDGYAVSLKVRNATLAPLSVAPTNYTVEVVDEDGDKYPMQQSPAAPVSLTPGGTTTLRFTFTVPKTIKIKSIRARERDGRVYVFPL